MTVQGARRGVVRRHGDEHLCQIDLGQERAEERPVDRLDHRPLRLGVAIVAGFVGALDVDVQPLESRDLPRRRPGPFGVHGRRLRAAGRDRDHGHAGELRDPALHRHLHEAPEPDAEPLGDRRQRGQMIGGVPDEDQVGGELSQGPPALVHRVAVEHLMRVLGELVDERGGGLGLLAAVQRPASLHR